MPAIEIIPDPRQLIVQLLSLIFLFFMFKKHGWKPAKEFLQKRQAIVSAQFDEAQEKNKEAIRLKEKYELQLTEVKEESERLINASITEGKIAYEKLLADAATEVSKKQEKAKAAIEIDRKLAHKKIKDELVDLTISGVEKIIKREVDVTVHEQLFEDLVAQVGGSHEQK